MPVIIENICGHNTSNPTHDAKGRAAKERIENTGSETMARVDKYSITSNIYEQIGKMLDR